MSLRFEKKLVTQKLPKTDGPVEFSLDNKTLEQKVKLLILRDLWNIDWKVSIDRKNIEIVPPETYDKAVIKKAMASKRKEIILANKPWIDKNIAFVRSNLANGKDVFGSKIDPVIEVCETAKQHKLFRMLRYYWSSPYSDYVGRRIKLIIRDKGLPNKPIIGIAALGSPIIHIPDRDNYIGWDKETRTQNLIYAMDAYVIGAVPPYNYLLGGKLISYILASNEVRKIYREKYKNKVTIIEKRVSNSLVGIFTTSLYGKSSQYNRLRYRGKDLFQEIGQTKGYGTLHLSEETINAMLVLLKSKNIEVSHKFGDGPSWVMRVIRAAGDMLGFDSDFLLQHSFKRTIYFVPLANNTLEVLNGKSKKPNFLNYSKKELVEFWRSRWYDKRKRNLAVFKNVIDFVPEKFTIE